MTCTLNGVPVLFIQMGPGLALLQRQPSTSAHGLTWKPPGGGYQGALSHDVIHGLDVTVALSIDRQVPADRMRLILDDMNPRQLEYFGVDLTGIRLQATDLDWTYGTGEPLTGTAQDLLLVLCDRALPPNHLSGHAADRFTAGVTR